MAGRPRPLCVAGAQALHIALGHELRARRRPAACAGLHFHLFAWQHRPPGGQHGVSVPVRLHAGDGTGCRAVFVLLCHRWHQCIAVRRPVLCRHGQLWPGRIGCDCGADGHVRGALPHAAHPVLLHAGVLLQLRHLARAGPAAGVDGVRAGAALDRRTRRGLHGALWWPGCRGHPDGAVPAVAAQGIGGGGGCARQAGGQGAGRSLAGSRAACPAAYRCAGI
ncbi:hypothetical protein D3C72_1573550 [compost metagenome]